MTSRDFHASVESGVRALNLSLPASDFQLATKVGLVRERALKLIEHMVGRAAANGFFLALGSEDARIPAQDYLSRLIKTAARAGASRVSLVDSVSALDPLSTFELVTPLAAKSPVDLEFHAHNDLGLTTANTVAAFRAGARHASVVLGVGERAGNAHAKRWPPRWLSFRRQISKSASPHCPPWRPRRRRSGAERQVEGQSGDSRAHPRSGPAALASAHLARFQAGPAASMEIDQLYRAPRPATAPEAVVTTRRLPRWLSSFRSSARVFRDCMSNVRPTHQKPPFPTKGERNELFR
ncbi:MULTISPECIES: hypothetical protein [Mesorhizobium]|uniref:hypothetical protein n=1 Tax=Mesorhizobium TaxID=68287 RepID=UPI001FE16C37|nr:MULTISPECIES: hypothetical protein [Mesorhizobium]